MHEARLAAPFIAALLLLSAGCGDAASTDRGLNADTLAVPIEVDLSPFFGNIAGTFVLFDDATGTTRVHDAGRASQPYIPASTFKIPNALIALETGVADGADSPLSRDPDVAPRADWWPESWLRDHTLTSALPASVVWYYQEIARRIGPERMQTMLDRFEYGNRDISGGIDRFWLTGGLRISAFEQIDFLRRFYHDDLGAYETNTQIVKDAMRLEASEAYILSGKTGWAGLGEGDQPDIGWLVGYLEREGNVYFYAMNIDIHSNADAAERLRITRDVLHHFGLL
jgi:beta-lactamase class D